MFMKVIFDLSWFGQQGMQMTDNRIWMEDQWQLNDVNIWIYKKDVMGI